MKKLFVLLNHSLNEAQLNEIKNLKVEKIITLSDELWKNIPPHLQDISPLLQDYFNILKQEAREGDFLLVQGDFGATYKMVEYAKSKNLIPLYATTHRETKETKNNDGSTSKQTIFKHCIFRKY